MLGKSQFKTAFFFFFIFFFPEERGMVFPVRLAICESTSSLPLLLLQVFDKWGKNKGNIWVI